MIQDDSEQGLEQLVPIENVAAMNVLSDGTIVAADRVTGVCIVSNRRRLRHRPTSPRTAAPSEWAGETNPMRH